MTKAKSPIHRQIALGGSMLVWALSAAVLTVRAQNRSGPAGEKEAQSIEDAKQERKKELDEMRRRAESTTIIRLAGPDRTPAKLVAGPLMRFSDQVISEADATLWAYGTKGRPAAVEKVCYYPTRGTKYQYVLFSISDGLIEARWPGEAGWSSTKPGVEMRVLPGGPKAAPAEAGRLLQMKDAARRFAVTMTGWEYRRQEMRLLSRPIHRYADPGSGLLDGAIFVFVVNGTNPDCLILIEIHGSDTAHATWKYGPLRMTDGGLNMRLDGNEVWSTDYRPGLGGRYANWVYFFATQQQPGQ